MQRFRWVFSSVVLFLIMHQSLYAEMPIPSAEGFQLASKQKESHADKTLEVGNRVDIRIYPEDEYIKGVQMEISSEGNITLPLIGKVKVDGLTIVEAERKLVEIIDADYLVNPEVVIELIQTEVFEDQKEFLNVSVLGAVRVPNAYDIEIKENAPITLIQAILAAGGFSDVANIKKIKIVRKSSGGNRVIRANADQIVSGEKADIELEEGDIVHVAESLF